MQDLLMLWDSIFADGISFDLVDYVFVAMLLYIKDASQSTFIVIISTFVMGLLLSGTKNIGAAIVPWLKKL